MNMDVIRKHLSLISKRTLLLRNAIIIVDGVEWHQEHLANEFENVTIIKLPSYSPELNL